LLGEKLNGEMTAVNYCARLYRRPIGAITTDDILEILKPEWETKFPTMDRLRGRLEHVFAHAIEHKLTLESFQNPAQWNKRLDQHLPRRGVAHKVVHQPRIDWRGAPRVYVALHAMPGLAARAYELVALTGTRKGDMLKARVKDFDLVEKRWVIPMTKTEVEHVVPLADPAVALVRPLLEGKGPEAKVFPIGETATTRVGEALVNAGIVGGGELTLHGWRGMIRTWCADTEVPWALGEAILAHVKKGTEAAYNHAQTVKPRRRVMANWARHLAGGKDADKVVRMHAQASA
jgi:integrase